MSYAKQAVARNTVIQLLGRFSSTAIGLASFVILWRMFDPQEYGVLTLALTFLAVFATLVDFGLTLTTVQLISEHKEKEQEILGNLLSLRLISAGLFLGSAPFIALLFPYESTVQILIAIGVLSYYSASVSQMLGGVFQKNLDMAKPTIAENINRLFVLLGITTAWVLGGGLIAVMWVFVIGNVLQLLTVIGFTKVYTRLTPQISFATWKMIIGRSWPIGASIFFNLIYLKGDILFLSLYRDAYEIGLYGTAYKIIEVIAAVPVMYMGLMLPILVRAWAEKEKERFQHALQDAFDFFTVVGVPVAAGLALTGRGAVTLVAGEAFAPAGPVLWLLGPALLFVFYGALFGHAIVGLNKQKPMTWAYASVAAITIAGYLWHIPIYGMWGAAFWTLISEALIAFIAATVVLRVSQSHLRLGVFVKTLIATTVMALAVAFIPLPHVLLQIAIGIVVYAFVLSAIGGPSFKTVRSLLFPKAAL